MLQFSPCFFFCSYHSLCVILYTPLAAGAAAIVSDYMAQQSDFMVYSTYCNSYPRALMELETYTGNSNAMALLEKYVLSSFTIWCRSISINFSLSVCVIHTVYVFLFIRLWTICYVQLPCSRKFTGIAIIGTFIGANPTHLSLSITPEWTSQTFTIKAAANTATWGWKQQQHKQRSFNRNWYVRFEGHVWTGIGRNETCHGNG